MTTKTQRARARASQYLTTGYPPELAAQMRATKPGQAHWAGTGPSGKTCGDCAHLGYWKQRHNASGDLVKNERTNGCQRISNSPAFMEAGAACGDAAVLEDATRDMQSYQVRRVVKRPTNSAK